MQRISIFIISLIILMVLPLTSFAQEDIADQEAPVNDTIVVKQKYGLRLGGDVGKLTRSFIDDDYTGFEISGDYRLTQKLYLAGELGTEENTIRNNYLDVTAKGNYFKAGIDYNLYKNWLDMENLIYTGLRVGVSTFSQNLNSYTVYTTDQYYEPFTSSDLQEYKGLSAIWVEFVVGIKAELVTNLFVGINVQLKGMVAEDQPENFENLFVPGFNRTFDSGRFGFGFGYNVSYLIPIFKKNKKIPVEE
ncbi:hypothetical protein LX77_00748 [Gelidibacter algens]|uniref:Outer membrane protein with beta-barrel domain n=1 Tax=Gelidibacter algens TaxID=49280 RepID=A0A327SBN9_9FLAO|nr:DUF6048 family protein [Gelidibacter algens]RAJ26499.1 hypothetical protein LX77_00748 [Gelidibacter algens]